MLKVKKGVTINKPRREVYEFWRKLENLPRFMVHLEAVRTIDERRSHWVVKGPAGSTVEWDAEILEEKANERIVWRSLPGSDVRQEGSVEFRKAPGDRGTEVVVELLYDAPAGSAGTMVAKLFGEDPKQKVRNDLRRFKQVMETGEVVLSDASLEGAGQGVLKQRPAQAPEMVVQR